MDWILSNKEWLFSGIGVAALSIGIGWFIHKRKGSETISADNRSVAAKNIKDSTISTGDARE